MVKSWARDAKDENGQLADEAHDLAKQLKDKGEQEILLKDRVEKLEVKVSKDEDEKGKLITALNEVEKKAAALEMALKDKDEFVLQIGEEKKEAIRQLCIWIDYHRDRYNGLREMILKTRTTRGQRGS